MKIKRIALTDGSGRWFNAETAELIKEETDHNGHNFVSRATGEEFRHEALFRTAGKIWILNKYSNYQGSKETYEEISNAEAAIWLTNQCLEHSDCETEIAELEIK